MRFVPLVESPLLDPLGAKESSLSKDFQMFAGRRVRGYLILSSGYLPRALGALFVLGGAGFIAKNILIVS